MKRKTFILCVTIIGLMIIGYTSERIYQSYTGTLKQFAAKNEPKDEKLTNEVPTNTTGATQTTTQTPTKPPTTKPSQETPTPSPSNTEAKIATYKKGDKGDKVVEIQKRLIKYGYELDTDGDFGNATFNAIWDFQGRLGLSRDGIIGPETIAKLNEEPTEKTKYKPPVVPAFNNTTTQNNLEKFLNDNTFSSETNYFIWVDLANQKVNLFEGCSKNWRLIKSMPCSTGKASTPTVKGNFSVQGKGSYFRVNSYVICKYYTQFYGNYLFHTVLLDNNGNIVDGTLGTPVSHGCIRLAIEDAKYIYDNVPLGTFVWIK